MTDLLIITTLQKELKSLLKMIPDHSNAQIDGKTELVFYKAQLRSNIEPKGLETIILHSSEHGRVQGAIHAIERWQPQYVFLVGMVRSVSDKVALGDIVIANKVIDYSNRIENEQDTLFRATSYSASKKLINVAHNFDDDSWISCINAKRPGPGTPQVHIGQIASSDTIISNIEFFEKMRKNAPNLIGVEMEAGGVMAELETISNKMDFFVVRAVSDLLDKNKNDNWVSYACDVSAAYTVSFIKNFISITERRCLSS